MDVKSYRLAHGLAVKDVVAALRTEYHSYSKATHCMVENPGRYGVKLLPSAERLLRERAGGRKADYHVNRHRLSCHVPEALHSAVKQAVEADGRYASVSDLVYTLVTRWLKRQKRAALDAANIEDGGRGNHSTDNIAPKGGDVK